MEKAQKNELEKAKFLYEQGNMEGSAKILRELVIDSEADSMAYYLLGLIELKQNNYGLARSYFDITIKKEPSNENAYYYVGVIFEKLGNYKEADLYFKKTLQLKPSHRAALMKEQNAPLQIQTEALSEVIDSPNKGTIDSPNSEFFQQLIEDTTPVAKKVVALIKELEYTVTPSLTSQGISIISKILRQTISSVIAIGFLSFLVLMAYNLYKGISTFNTSNETIGLFIPPFFSISNALLLIFIVTIIRTVLNIWEAFNKKYELAKGKVTITTGGLTRKVKIIELYRIVEVEMSQDFIQQLTKDGSLILKYTMGFANEEITQHLVEKLRELVALIRSVTWIKGIVN